MFVLDVCCKFHMYDFDIKRDISVANSIFVILISSEISVLKIKSEKMGFKFALTLKHNL